MRLIRIAIAAGAVAFASAAQATTVIVFVEPMTMARHTRVIDTPGPDRFVMCVEPPRSAAAPSADDGVGDASNRRRRTLRGRRSG